MKDTIRPSFKKELEKYKEHNPSTFMSPYRQVVCQSLTGKLCARILSLSILSLFLMACCFAGASMEKKYESKNFRNGAFHNRNATPIHTFWEVVWGSITSDESRSKWPDKIETMVDSFPVQRVSGGSVRITFVNHATFLIQVAGFNILTDPVFSERTSPFSFVGPKRIHDPGISIEGLPPIDVVIISHDHYDHLDTKTIKKLVKRDNPIFYVGLGVGGRLPTGSNIVELDWWQSNKVSEDFQLWFLDAQHASGRSLSDRNTTLWGAFMLEVDNQKIYFGGDTGYSDHFKRAFNKFGVIDIAFLPIGAYAPQEFFKPIHMNPDEAVQAHVDLQSRLSIGMHYGTFQLSAEPLNEPVELLEKARRSAEVGKNEFITLEIGSPYDVAHSSKE